MALETKWRFNKDAADGWEAKLECRYEIEQVANWTTLITSLFVSAFVVFIFYLGVQLWLTQPDKDVAWAYVAWAGCSFLAIYVVMTGYLPARGYLKARTLLKQAIEKLGG